MLEIKLNELLDVQKGLVALANLTENRTLVDKLIDKGVFTKEDFFKFSYQVSKLIRRVKEPAELHESELFKISKRYGEQQKDKDGNLIDSWAVTKNREEYLEAVKAISEDNVKIEDVSKIKLSTLQKINVGASLQTFLAPIIDEDIKID